MDRLGFIGLDPMGGFLSRRLLEGGFALVVHDAEPENAKYLLDRGAAWADTPALVAQSADLVLTAPSDPSLLEAFINGPSGVLEGALPGLVILNLAPVASETVRRLGSLCRESQVDFFDAALDGSPGDVCLALKADLPQEVFSKYQAILEAMCGEPAPAE